MDGIERIKVLSSEIRDEALLKIVEYLISRNDMNEKYLNEEKNLSQMVEYIKTEAQKHAHDGMAIILNEVVFGWAIHYWDESNAKLKLSTEKEENKEDIEEQITSVKQEPKKVKEWVAEGQLSLF